jgi:hypothetical protein
MTTRPDRKPSIKNEDNMKPAFQVGDYVEVDEDTSANMKHPEGFGFVQAVKGVGAATLASIKYDTCFDSGHTHHDVPFELITAAVYGQDFDVGRVKRAKVERGMYTPPSGSDSPKSATTNDEDTRLPVEILVDKLAKAARFGQKRMAQG